MALAGGIGAEIDPQLEVWTQAWLFGEDQGRYLITVPDEKAFTWSELENSGLYLLQSNVPFRRIGETGGGALKLAHWGTVSLAELRAAHEGFFPRLMGSELTPDI